MNVSSTFEERFWSKVDKRGPDECWEWTGPVNDKGYGKIHEGGRESRQLYAHRIMVALQGFAIRPNRMVHHTCGNRRCVNPKHLEVTTYSVNNRGENRGNREVLHGGEPLELDLSGNMNKGNMQGA